MIAGCETDVLKAGEYTVKYGKRTFGLRIPSVMVSPASSETEVNCEHDHRGGRCVLREAIGETSGARRLRSRGSS